MLFLLRRRALGGEGREQRLTLAPYLWIAIAVEFIEFQLLLACVHPVDGFGGAQLSAIANFVYMWLPACG